jgi:hypothetical protein
MRGAQAKNIEVDALPAHRHLDYAMQFTQRERRRHQDAPPYHQTNADQPDFDLQDRVGVHGGLR